MNVELSDITRKFGRNVAVNGVTLDVGPGVLGLLGPNGAGKTSLLRMLATRPSTAFTANTETVRVSRTIRSLTAQLCDSSHAWSTPGP